jgi:Secretion system C-terminal sorting domain
LISLLIEDYWIILGCIFISNMMKNFTWILMLFLLFTASGQAQDHFALNNRNTIRFIKFYPNPATSFIIIELQKNQDKNYSFLVFNFSGKKIIDMPVSGKTRIDLTSYTRGLYIFQLKDHYGKTIEAGKFQVEK